MIELYIDGTAAVLPSDLSTDIVIANSFFTKNGEYSYDIKLSLKNSINAALYSHLNRVNSVTELKTKRRAVLVADNRVMVDGTEIVTDWDADTVSVQLASGNSELNYLVGSDELISTFDMGTVNANDINESIYKSYPTVAFVAAPVYNRTTDEVMNEWQVGDSDRVAKRLRPGTSAVAQPYLCTMINRLISAMGYTLGKNQLEDTDFKDLFIINTVATDKYCEMLPGWTAKEFLEEVEKLFNIVIVIDKKTKICNIIFANAFYIGAQEIHLSAVEDGYEAEISEDNEGNVTDSNIVYDLPSNEYYRFRHLNKAIKDKATIMDFAGYDKVSEYFSSDTASKFAIGIDTTTGRKYCKDIVSETSALNLFRPVDEFCDLDRGATAEIKLSMVPAELYYYFFKSYSLDNSGETAEYMSWIPVVDADSSAEASETDEGSIQGMIEYSVDVVEESKGKIFLAFYEGQQYFNVTKKFSYPLSTPDQLPIINLNMVGTWNEDKSLRLEVLNRLLYSGVFKIDTTKEYTFYCSDPNIPDAHGIFVIHNKRFVCKEMTFSISKSEKVKRWKLSMYPIDISDTEAMSRWILADGKWRDGGVWLDDGRWLD